MGNRALTLRPAALAIWASFLCEWQQRGRQKAQWVYVVGLFFAMLAPLLLAQLAFGTEGFAASGGGSNSGAVLSSSLPTEAPSTASTGVRISMAPLSMTSSPAMGMGIGAPPVDSFAGTCR